MCLETRNVLLYMHTVVAVIVRLDKEKNMPVDALSCLNHDQKHQKKRVHFFVFFCGFACDGVVFVSKAGN